MTEGVIFYVCYLIYTLTHTHTHRKEKTERLDRSTHTSLSHLYAFID